MENPQIGDLLTNFEAEHLIEKLKIIEIEEYGSNAWFRQDEVYQRLNMQAHVNAMIKTDEFIMESMVTFDKVKTLIFDLIQAETWKIKVLPLLKDHMLNVNTYRSYIVLYHEAVICNILEVIMYHRTAVDSAEEFLVELIDYCYRKLITLTKYPQTKQVPKMTVEDVLKTTRSQEYQQQIEEIELKIGMMCISIIRFLTDYVRYLPVSVIHHMLEVTDILCVLVPLIEDKPWIRKGANGEREKYENGKWMIVDKGEYSKIVKLEANVWIAIYNLFMEPECRKKYELSDFRKSNLLRVSNNQKNIDFIHICINQVRKYMNEMLLDQIPNLSHMLRALEELSIMNVQTMTKNNPFIVQQVPEIREKIARGKNWKEIAERQKKEFFVNNKEQAKEDMQRLADLYGQNIIDGLTEGFHCELCKKEASKRCSNCKAVWYCSRECQLAHWKEHKVPCKKSVEENKQKQQRKQDMISEVTKENEKAQQSQPEQKAFVTEIVQKVNDETVVAPKEVQIKEQDLDALD